MEHSVWYAAAAAEHLVSRGQPVVTSVTGESRATGPFNLSTNTYLQTSESKGASHTQVSTYLWTLSEEGGVLCMTHSLKEIANKSRPRTEMEKC